ncbi:MAG: hypothetical protein AB8B86_00055 [Pseudomonadales bacterium]
MTDKDPSASQSDQKYIEPVDAATLILLRDDEVLMGLRNRKHIFMPNVYVFPGGRTDADDHRLSCTHQLTPTQVQRLSQSVDAERANAIALTALRETFEETGLIVGHASKADVPDITGWDEFYRRGFEPAVDQLEYFARAITPEGGPRRYDARFFVADAQLAQGELAGDGELLDLQWISLRNTSELKLPTVTTLVLELLKSRFYDDQPPAKQVAEEFAARYGREVFEYYA